MQLQLEMDVPLQSLLEPETGFLLGAVSMVLDRYLILGYLDLQRLGVGRGRWHQWIRMVLKM